MIPGDCYVESYVAPYAGDEIPRFVRGRAYTDTEEEELWRSADEGEG